MAIQNLLDNASKYTPERGQITVSVKTADDDISIVIEDTGVGISEENIPLLFQRFSRIPNELSTLVGGSGLGLYWAHSIVDLHGGTIEVVSKPGEGSTFTIKLSQGHDDA
jgi:two-component system sensor histidine kinase VicK